MSKEAITKVVQRAISDAGFRRQLSTDPTGALRGFDLSADETAALRAGDAGRLSAMGVDQRMSKAFVLGGATVGASRAAGSDLANASSVIASDASAAADARGNALVSDNLSESDAMISDGGTSMRGIIPADPHLRNADADGAASAASARVGDDWKFTDRAAGSVAPIEGSPEATAAELKANTGGMANYPAHDGLAGPSGVASATASDSAARLARLDDRLVSEGSPAVDASAGSDNAARLARLDDRLASEGSPAIDASGGSAGETAFIDDSEGYLTSVGYDPNVSTSAVTDAHDRGEGAISSAVTDAHDRGDVTRIADGDDAGGTSAASEDGPNISS
jgi:hypothetical protein